MLPKQIPSSKSCSLSIKAIPGKNGIKRIKITQEKWSYPLPTANDADLSIKVKIHIFVFLFLMPFVKDVPQSILFVFSHALHFLNPHDG